MLNMRQRGRGTTASRVTWRLVTELHQQLALNTHFSWIHTPGKGLATCKSVVCGISQTHLNLAVQILPHHWAPGRGKCEASTEQLGSMDTATHCGSGCIHLAGSLFILP